MQKIELKLQIGEHIVHSAHGIGRVKGITIKKLRGEKQVFYRVKTNRLTYWLPVVNFKTDRIRPVRSPATFRAAISTIRKKSKHLNKNFRSRLKYINDELSKCALIANARLIRDLHARNFDKPLHINEGHIYEKLREQYINEWSISANISKAEAEEKLNYALLESIGKI